MNNSSLLISAATLGSGGAERVLSILSHPFADNYSDITLILWKHFPEFYQIDERIKIKYIPEYRGIFGFFKQLIWFRKFVKSNKISTILSFLYPYSIRVILSLLTTPVNIIVAERRDPRKVKGGIIVRWIRDLLYIKAKKIIVQSTFNKRLYPFFLKSKITVLYNPIKITPSTYVYSTNNRVITVGRLINEKNHKLLIDAFTIFHKTHPNYTLEICGDGPLHNELKDYATSKGLILNNDIYLPGNVKNIDKELSKASMFVLTSKSEGMPNALYEALCKGIPCISTKVTGVMDLIRNREQALLVSEDATKISEAMSEIADNKEFAEYLGKQGKNLYQILNPTHVAQQWVKEIQQVIENSHNED